MTKNILLLLSLVALSTMESSLIKPRSEHRALDATLWVQSSAEWRAHAEQAYNLAHDQLDEMILDTDWTASMEQLADTGRSEKKPAIIVDIDETVLDNSPYQARLVLDNTEYNPKTWKSWVEQAQASPIPGALPFLTAAAKKGVEIFYVTNRLSSQEAATRKNLERLDFPLQSSFDTVLMKGEHPDWTSDKKSRRTYVAKTHRIIMLIGDDFGDFCSAARAGYQARLDASAASTPLWGRGWYILPNPNYGSWTKSVVHFGTKLSSEAKEEFERRALDPRRP